MECVPTVNVVTVSWAELFERAAEPSEVAPSMNVTVPVALPPNAGWIAADSVIDCPKTDGFALEAATVVVASPFTV